MNTVVSHGVSRRLPLQAEKGVAAIALGNDPHRDIGDGREIIEA